MDGDPSRFVQNGAVKDRPPHPASVVDIGADHFNLGTGTVNEIKVVAQPIKGHPLDALQLSFDQHLDYIIT